MRENAFSKARRYLTEGRLLIVRVDQDFIDALCRGDGKIYGLQMRHGQWFDQDFIDALCRGDGKIYGLQMRHGQWSCDCPAKTDQCSHLRALRLVCVADREHL